MKVRKGWLLFGMKHEMETRNRPSVLSHYLMDTNIDWVNEALGNEFEEIPDEWVFEITSNSKTYDEPSVGRENSAFIITPKGWKANETAIREILNESFDWADQRVKEWHKKTEKHFLKRLPDFEEKARKTKEYLDNCL